MENSRKKIIISSVLIVLLVALIVGLTYAVFEYASGSTNNNSISTGRISMSYTEPTNALILENALPMSDDEGTKQTKYFEFSVTSHATTNANGEVIEIPYEVNISDIEIDEGKVLLPSNAIKFNLVQLNGTDEEEVAVPILLSKLSASELTDGVKLYETTDIHRDGNDAIITTYRLRAWIDKDFDVTGNTYQYKFRVNINSEVDSATPLKLNKVMLEVWEEERTALSDNNDGIMRLANDASQNSQGKWVEVTNERKLEPNDKVRITFIYNKYLQGEAPTLSLKFDDTKAKNEASNGAIDKNKISYEYTISGQDDGNIVIGDLTGGSITDLNNTVSTIEITQELKQSLKGYAEVQSNLSNNWKKLTAKEESYVALYTLDQATLPSTYTYGNNEYRLTATIDVSEQGNGKVLLGEYASGAIAVITQKGGVVAPVDSSGLFEKLSNMRVIDLSNLDTSNVTNMRSMFALCYNLTELDISSFNTSNVTDMMSMFNQCKILPSLDLSSFDTGKVTNMSFMFQYSECLTSLDLTSFDTSNVTDMTQMFYNCTNLTPIIVGCGWHTGVSTNAMFSGCKSYWVTKVCNE